jgi:hypothetical protein
MEKQKGIIWAVRHWTAKPGVLERCSKAAQQVGTERCCFIQQVSSSSLRFLVVYMPG